MKKDIESRIRNVIGQLSAVLRMYEQGISCEAQLTQLKAAKAAISSIMTRLIEEEIGHCSKVAQKQQVVAKLLAELANS